MIVRILSEIGLAVITLFAAGLFWQLIKRKKFLVNALENEHFLKATFSEVNLDTPPPTIEVFAKEFPHGYAVNLKITIQADQVSQRRVLIPSVAVLLIVLCASYYFLGPIYFVINLALFGISFTAPIWQSTYNNAIEQIATLALILHRWHQKDTAECEQFIQQAWALRPLYNAITKQD